MQNLNIFRTSFDTKLSICWTDFKTNSLLKKSVTTWLTEVACVQNNTSPFLGHYDLDMAEFQFQTDGDGRRYVAWIEGGTKTRQPGLSFQPRTTFPRMYETGGERCPVKIFNMYRNHRPLDQRDSGPFYLAVIDAPSKSVWYKRSRMGKNTLGSIVQSIVAGTKLHGTKRFSNHSVRKTNVNTLQSAGFSRDQIRTVTGHRRVESLDLYSREND